MILHDYVYYLKVDGKLIEELIFESKAVAIEFAIASGDENYEVVEWDCQ